MIYYVHMYITYIYTSWHFPCILEGADPLKNGGVYIYIYTHKYECEYTYVCTSVIQFHSISFASRLSLTSNGTIPREER